ncbi:MAG: PAS domain S-box protein, partial [Bacteroidota bacterium]
MKSIYNDPILIVVVNADLRVAYDQLLSKNGYKVTCTGTGQGALDLVDREAFSLVLLDEVLPDILGLDVLKRIKSNPVHENLFVVLISSLATSSAKQSEGLETGADGYIVTPLENREFLARIDAFIRHKRTLDKLRTSELMFKRLATNNMDGILIIDADKKIRFANSVAEELFSNGKKCSVNSIFAYPVSPEGNHTIKIHSKSGSARMAEMLISELEWEGKLMKLISVRENTRQMGVAEKVREHLAEQQIISEVAKKLIFINNKEELYKYIGERVFELVGDAYVYVGSFDAEKQTVVVRNLFGFGKLLEKVHSTLNIDVFKISVPVYKFSHKLLNLYKSSEIVHLTENGLFTLTAGLWNKNICKAVEKMLGITAIDVMGFNCNNEYYGGIGVLCKANTNFKKQKLVKNLANLASVALQKLFTEEKLQQEHNNLNAILSSSPVGMLVIDQNHFIVKANPAACKLFNKDSSDLHNSLCGDFLSCIHQKETEKGCGFSTSCESCHILSAINTSLASQQKITDEEAQITRDSEIGKEMIWLRFSVEPLLLNGHNHCIISLHDITKNKMAEQEVQRTEKHFRLLIERAPDGVVLIGHDGNYKYVSPSAYRMFGDPQGIRVLTHPSESTHPDDLPMVLAVLSELISNPEYVPTIEYRVRHANGSWRWIESTFTNLLAEPAIDAIVINFRDIDDRKEAEKELEYSEKRFRSLIENSSDAIVVIDQQGGLLYESPAYSSISGRNINERTGKNGFEFIHPGDKPALKQLLDELLQHPQEVQHITIRYQHANGSWLWLDCTLTNLLEEPAIEGIVVNVHDITRQTAAREAMRMSEVKYKGLFEANKDGISIVYLDEKDNLGKFAEVNTSAAAMLGYTKNEMLNLSVYELEVNGDNDKLEWRKKQIHEKGHASEEAKLRHKNGDVLTVDLLVFPIQYNDRIALINIVRDITERKQTEGMLHDMIEKNPMSIQTVDKDGFTLHINPAHTILFGSVPPSDFSIFADLQNKYPEVEEYILRAKNGEVVHLPDLYFNVHDSFPDMPDVPVWVRVVIFPLNDNNGRPLRFVFMHENITESKKAEVALKESERLLRESQAVANLGSFVWNLSTGYWQSSEILDRIFGIDEKYIRSFDGWSKIVHPDWQEIMTDYVTNEVLTKRQEFDKEYKITRPEDGKELWVHGIAKLDVNKDNQPVKLIGTISDITNRKQAEEDLVSSEQKYRLLADNVSDVIWSMDNNFKFTYISPSIMQLRGPSQEEAMNEPFESSMTPESLQIVQNAVKKSIEEEKLGIHQKQAVIEIQQYHKNGMLIWVELAVQAMLDSDGKKIGLIGISRDITKRKTAEAALVASEQKYRKLHESMMDGYVFVDMQGFIRDYNESYRLMLGYNTNELLQLTFRDITPGQWHKFEASVVSEQVLPRGFSDIYHKEYRKKDGTVFPVEVHAFLIKSDAGENEGIWAIVRDITKRKMAEEALQLSEQRFKKVFNEAPMGIALIESLTGIIKEVIPMFAKISGRSIDEMKH